MEKNTNDSITTVQMKADYAASEIYSTASEAPPAYPLREASSVKIAKIIALTVLLASVIIGSFALGSVYLQARASCDHMQALDSMLEKELMLETMQQEMPKAEALLQAAADDSADNADDEKMTNQVGSNNINKKSESADQLSDADTFYSDNDESADLNRNSAGVHVKMPLELNLSELAHAIVQSSRKSRMNCVIERRQAEEFVDDGNNDLYNGEPRKRVTGERMAIFCESGSESKPTEPQAEQIPIHMMRPAPIPYGAIPQHFPLTHMPMQMEPRPMPPQMQPQPQPQQQQHNAQSTVIQRLFPQQFIIRQIHLQPQPQQPEQQQQPPSAASVPFHISGPQQQQQQQQPHLVALRFNIAPPTGQQLQHISQPDQMLTAPRPMMPMPEERSIPYQIRQELLELQKQHEMQMQHQQPPPQPQPQPPQPMMHQMQQMQQLQQIQQIQQQMQQAQQHNGAGVQLQRVPLSLALQRVGITSDDLRNIQRMAEARIQHEMQHMQDAGDARPTSSSSSSPSTSSSAAASSSFSDSSDADSSDEESSEGRGSSDNTDGDSDEDSQILQIGRATFGRSVVTPIRIPVNLMQAITQAEDMAASVMGGGDKAGSAEAHVEHRAIAENPANADDVQQ